MYKNENTKSINFVSPSFRETCCVCILRLSVCLAACSSVSPHIVRSYLLIFNIQGHNDLDIWPTNL